MEIEGEKKGYITLHDEENQLNKLKKSYNSFQTISLVSSEEIIESEQCIVCYNTDIPEDKRYTCKICTECLLCESCAIKTLKLSVSKNTQAICPVCRSKNWCINSKGKLVNLNPRIKKSQENNERTPTSYDNNFRIIICIIVGIILFFIFFYENGAK